MPRRRVSIRLDGFHRTVSAKIAKEELEGILGRGVPAVVASPVAHGQIHAAVAIEVSGGYSGPKPGECIEIPVSRVAFETPATVFEDRWGSPLAG